MRPSASPAQPSRSASADAGGQVVADAFQPRPLSWVNAEEGAPDAAVLVRAAGSPGAAAVAEGHLPPLEVAEELVPFLVAGNPVFLAGAGGAAAGDERPVGVDHLFGVGGLVSHRDVDVGVPGHELGDVRRHAVHHGIGDEEPAVVVGGEGQRLPAGVSQPGAGQRGVQQPADPVDGDGPVLDADLALEQQRHRRVPDALVDVVGHHQRDRAVVAADPADDRAEDVGELGRDDQQPLGIGLATGRSAAAGSARRWRAAGTGRSCGATILRVLRSGCR